MNEANEKSYGWAAVLTVALGAAVIIPSMAALVAALFAAATVLF